MWISGEAGPEASSWSDLASLQPPSDSAKCALLAKGLRSNWRRRCALLFNEPAKALSWGGTVVAAAEILLAEGAWAGDRGKETLKVAFHSLLPPYCPRLIDCSRGLPKSSRVSLPTGLLFYTSLRSVSSFNLPNPLAKGLAVFATFAGWV
ncbi:hypothetical protein R1sor_024468 [Riccia sorocarpa]|uniref:Uncharacterized protein n=1 Tax=Riccia sorocarpa TaxID=122646 RepID=A0ABD3GQK4_9MARC